MFLLVKDNKKNEIESYQKKAKENINLQQKKNINGQVKTNKKNLNKITKNENINNIWPKISIKETNKILLIHRLRKLSPWAFEWLLMRIFKYNWYEIVEWPRYLWDKPQVDNWYDLILKKDNDNTYVQIKKKISYPIHEKQLREFKGTILLNKWIYITTSLFSKNAKRYADKNDIELLDYEDILDAIYKLDESQKWKIETIINATNNMWDRDWKPKTCKECWAPMRKWIYWYYCLNRYESKECHNKKNILQ